MDSWAELPAGTLRVVPLGFAGIPAFNAPSSYPLRETLLRVPAPTPQRSSPPTPPPSRHARSPLRLYDEGLSVEGGDGHPRAQEQLRGEDEQQLVQEREEQRGQVVALCAVAPGDADTLGGALCSACCSSWWAANKSTDTTTAQ